MSSRLHFLCISADATVKSRCAALAKEFEYSYQAMDSIDDYLTDQSGDLQIQFVLVDATQEKNKENLSGLIQTTRQVLKESFICALIESNSSDEVAILGKKAGASLILLLNDFLQTSRLEFIASQIIRASYVPVKLSEFPKDSVLDFTLYHLLPLNQKLLPILPKGTPLGERRLNKLQNIGEVFVRRDEVDRYRHYVEDHPDSSGQGLRSRCRAQYLSFCNSHSQLIFLISDHGETNSIRESKWLFERCEILAKDLITSLSAVGEAWDVVNNAAIGEFGSVERAPTIAAYAGLLSLLASMSEPLEVMIAGILSDVGMLELSPQITQKIRQAHGTATLSPDELARYQKHPQISVERCLSKKIPVSEAIQKIILCTHERADGKGFPDQRKADAIPMGALLVQFSELIDRGAMVKMGQPRQSVQQVRKQLIEHETAHAEIFTSKFLLQLKPVI